MKIWKKTQISIYFISRQFGVLLVIKTICVINVFMHIIGKISEGRLTLMSTKIYNAKPGKQRTILRPTKMVATLNIDVVCAMAGRN